jgi:hypothetical protein
VTSNVIFHPDGGLTRPEIQARHFPVRAAERQGTLTPVASANSSATSTS